MAHLSTEDRVRRRVAEILSAAGIPSSAIALQSLFLMPPDFADAYQELFHRALRGAEGEGSGTGVGAGGGLGSGEWVDEEKAEAMEARIRAERRGTAPPGMRTKSGQETASLHARRGVGKGRRHRTVWTVRDERALEMKGRIDRKLRRLGRELRGFLGDEGETLAARRCSGRSCKRFVELEWRFCPHCGADQRSKRSLRKEERSGRGSGKEGDAGSGGDGKDRGSG